jgi:hypothetical protein
VLTSPTRLSVLPRGDPGEEKLNRHPASPANLLTSFRFSPGRPFMEIRRTPARVVRIVRDFTCQIARVHLDWTGEIGHRHLSIEYLFGLRPLSSPNAAFLSLIKSQAFGRPHNFSKLWSSACELFEKRRGQLRMRVSIPPGTVAVGLSGQCEIG